MPNINDCIISWSNGRLRVQHLPSGYEVDRQVALRDDWKLDDLLSQLDVLLGPPNGIIIDFVNRTITDI